MQRELIRRGLGAALEDITSAEAWTRPGGSQARQTRQQVGDGRRPKGTLQVDELRLGCKARRTENASTSTSDDCALTDSKQIFAARVELPRSSPDIAAVACVLALQKSLPNMCPETERRGYL